MRIHQKSIIPRSLVAVVVCLAFAAIPRITDAASGTLQKAPAMSAPSKYQTIMRLGPDLAITSFNVTKSAAGRLSIQATVKNIGSADYTSNPNQQSVTLQVYNPSITGPASIKILVTRNFTNLAKGATMTVSANTTLEFFKEWNDPTPDPGECLAERIVSANINFDPDIRMDGNKNNDDTNSSNNTKTETVKYIAECPW